MSYPYRVTLTPATPETADPLSGEALRQATEKYGFLPNLYARMATVPGLLETYRLGYERFRNDCGFSLVEQEVVFLAVAVAYGCQYCTAAHSVSADVASKVPRPVTDALRDGVEVPDSRLRTLAAFTRAMVETAGRPSEAEVATFVAAGYGEHHIVAIVLAIAVKTLSSYVNRLFSTPLDAPLQRRAWYPRTPAAPDHEAGRD